MTLSYTDTFTQSTQQTRTVEVVAPQKWGMYSSGGNKSLEKKAERLLKKVQANKSTVKRLAAFAEFFRGWRSMQNTKTMRESGDTAVREVVWGFALEVGRCVGIDNYTLDTIWDSDDAYPKRK